MGIRYDRAEPMHSDHSMDEAASRGDATDTPGHVPPTIRIRQLDWFELVVDGERRELPQSAQRLLALLALNRDGMSRSDAAALLTPHLSVPSGRRSLRTALSRVRRSCPDVIEADADTVRLAPHVSVDAWEVERLAARVATGRPPPGFSHHERLAVTLLYDWTDPWVVAERARLWELCLEALLVDARRLAWSGDIFDALGAAYRALDVEPLRDEIVCLMLQLDLSQGNAANARRRYHRFEQCLSEECGAAPSAEMEALMAPVLPGARGPWRRFVFEPPAASRRSR